ncbi:MAG: hypothetical protein C0625_10880 [Arcobacter sp.]|nr:MAG: hypothetical protein C0625_10880 [Arcobacter sp.]
MGKLSYKLSIPTIMLLGVSYLGANSIKEVVEHTMSNNPKIISTLKNNDAYSLYVDEAKGGYYPKLDLTAYVETKRTRLNPDVGTSTKNKSEGGNARLDFEQLIFDGGLTSGQIDEAQFRYTSNKYLNESIVDDIIYNSIDSYLNLVKYKNRLAVTDKSLAIYNDYLVTARQTEEISGEILQKAQVNAKVHYTNSKFYEDTNNSLRAASSFKKNVGMETDGKSCRPNLDNSLVPGTLKGLIDEVLLKNPLILEQVENIKEQRAILNQKDASFYPTLKFKAQAVYDDDLVTDFEKTTVYSGRIELTYNIFNGNKDRSASLREKAFLEESQKTLDTVTSEVVDTATAAYNKYMYSGKRVSELKSYIQDNKNILAIYKDQFQGGTRTFIDVLNVERDLASAREDLIDAEYDLDSSYFQIANSLGSIKESVVNSNNATCSEVKPVIAAKKTKKVETTSEEVQAMLAEDTAPANATTTVYGLYLIAYENIAQAESTVSKAQEMLGDTYKIKIEEARGYNSVVVYDIATMDEVNSVKSQLKGNFPGSYIKKFKK